MLIEGQALEYWIDNFYGYGSWHAKLWFVAYEESGGDLPDAARWRTGTAHRRAWRHGRVRTSELERDQSWTRPESSSRSQSPGEQGRCRKLEGCLQSLPKT